MTPSWSGPLVALALACQVGQKGAAAPPVAQEVSVPAQVVVTIPDTGNVRVGAELELGAGNIWADDADGGQGPLGAGLWILLPKVSSKRIHHRVHQGQELTEGGFRLKVLEIVKKPERAGSFVRVQVERAG